MRAKFHLAFSMVLFCALLLCGQADADVSVGQDAPALAGTTLDGKTFDLSALKGKVVVINFWASWCPPCREEMPALEAVWRHYHGKGMEVLAVSADRPRARGDVTQVMQYFSFPAAMLGNLSKNDFGAPGAIPITYVIGKDGKLAAILTPDTVPLTEPGLGGEIQSLLDGKKETSSDENNKNTPGSDAKP